MNPKFFNAASSSVIYSLLFGHFSFPEWQLMGQNSKKGVEISFHSFTENGGELITICDQFSYSIQVH